MVYKKNYPKKNYQKNKEIKQVARKEVKKALNQEIETKAYDGIVDDVETTFYGTTYSMTYNYNGSSSMVQGITDYGYLGNKIQPFMLQIRWRLANTGTADVSYNMVRILVLQVIGGGTPSPANVLAFDVYDYTPLSPYDRNYRDTYRVLHDKLHIINYDSVEAICGKITIKKNMAPITFSDASGTIQTGGIYVVIYSDEDSLDTSPKLSMCHRLYYKDA